MHHHSHAPYTFAHLHRPLPRFLRASAAPSTLEEIHGIKTELVCLRESTWPLREVVDRIVEAKTPLLKASMHPCFRDVYDHAVHAIDIIETFRDIVSGILDIYLSSVSLKLNEVMKVLTLAGTIFLPLAFLASVYGMNFRELEVSSPGVSCVLAC